MMRASRSLLVSRRRPPLTTPPSAPRRAWCSRYRRADSSGPINVFIARCSSALFWDRACERNGLLTYGVAKVLFGIGAAHRPEFSARDGLGKAPVLERLLSELRADDVVVVTRLDRLARSTSELLRIAETIEEKNAGLQSIAEPWADTTTPAGRMVLTVLAGIAEFERSLIAARTEEGRRAAQARGVPFGRPPKLRPDQRTLARNLIEEGKSVSDVARTFNVHVATIYRCLHDEATL